MTTKALATELAARVKERRLERGWSRAELARRAGVAEGTLKLFEQTGRIALERLLKIAVALGALQEFTELFPAPPAQSLAEIEARLERPRRKRGRRTSPAPSIDTADTASHPRAHDDDRGPDATA